MTAPSLSLPLMAFLLLALPNPAMTRSPMKHKPLTPAEAHVIEHKGTERPWSGRFVNHDEAGQYTCKRCDAPLFSSATKFDAGCGWPSFDQALPGAVREAPDADGRRTEILCAACGAHLGHVFRGEGHTVKNTRHCVNSISLGFEAEAAEAAEEARAYFAGGCFWGVEHHLARAPGVLGVTSGYMGGRADDPSYGEVCTGTTGHAEAVEVVYDPGRTSYEDLARLFFEIHDPTQVDRQGPDMGPQYRSAVFYHTPEQQAAALQSKQKLEQSGKSDRKIVTRIVPAAPFWRAEEYHQRYLEKRRLSQCHIR